MARSVLYLSDTMEGPMCDVCGHLLPKDGGCLLSSEDDHQNRSAPRGGALSKPVLIPGTVKDTSRIRSMKDCSRG